MPTDQQTVNAVSVETAEHYIWGTVCDGWHLLKMEDMSVIEEAVPPGAGEVKHFHSKARQFFYVLEGQATIEFNDCTVLFSVGQGLHVAPGVQHRFCNLSSGNVRFLVFSAPTTRGDRTNAA